MIRTGPAPAPAVPAVLPGLAGRTLLDSLEREHRRLAFVAEHLEHPMVPEGVADGIHEALDALERARHLQAQLLLGMTEWPSEGSPL